MISAVVLAKDEEENIKGCIQSLSFCNEIVVIDDGSIDKTVEIAIKMGARVYKRKLNNFASQRNFGLNKTKGDWILFVDADERISKQLAVEIVQVINDPTFSFDAFNVKRVDYIWGRALKHGETGTLKLLRLAKKSKGKWKRQVHEYWDVKGNVYALSNPLKHYPHPSIHQFVESINRMSGMHATANMAEGKNSSIFKIIIWPQAKFIVNYIFKLGFLDGMQGFVVAMLMSIHSFLAWSKLWLFQKRA